MNRLAKLAAFGVGSFAFFYSTNPLAFLRSDEKSRGSKSSTKMLENDISRIKLFSVTDQTELANEIAFYLKTKIGKLQVIRKENESKPIVNVLEDVNSKEIFLICSFNPAHESIKESIDDLVTSIYALKTYSPSKVNVVLPYYSNSHYSEQSLPFTEEELSELLENAGADKIFTVNMHENQHNAPFHIPLVELDAHRLCGKYFKTQQLKDLVIVYTNESLEEKASQIKTKLEKQGHKVSTRMIKETDESKANGGDKSIEGHDVLLVDNIVDSGRPLYNISNYLNKLRANSIHMFAIHGVINDETVDFIDYSPIKELVITNTLPLDSSHLSPKINQISVAKMIANTIAESTFHKNLQQLYQEKSM